MTAATEPDKLVIRDGAIICPRCLRKIRGVRILEDAEARGINVQCNHCKTQLDIEITSGQRYGSPRH